MRPLVPFVFLLCGLAAAMVVPGPVLAQGMSGLLNTAGLNDPSPTDTDNANLDVDFNHSFDALNNPYLSDSMRLNYQINLLGKMTERQAELLKISDSFAALGIPFVEPAPARGLCAQLPPNAPCLKHYPDLYAPLVDQRKSYYNRLRAQEAASTGAEVPMNIDDPAAIERARKAKAEQERKAKEEQAKAEAFERATRYQWSDVSCIGTQCSGVIISARMPGYRATVHKGTRLADGTVIENIYVHGIRAVVGADHVDLRPAASEGGAAPTGLAAMAPAVPSVISVGGGEAPSAAAAAIAAAATSGSTGVSISNVQELAVPAAPGASAAGGGQTTAAAAPAPGATGGDMGTSTVEPPLGPSGLF